MAKVTQKICLFYCLISSILFSTVYLVTSPENYGSNNKVKLSDSDSWTKIVNEGERWPYLELYNNSLYVFCFSGHVSKFSASGSLLWEYPLKVDDPPSTHAFDSNGNLLILSEKSSRDELSLIKLSSSGELLYSKNILLEDRGSDSSITLGVNDSIIVTGHSYTDKLFIFKLNSNGNLLWNNSFSVRNYWRYPFIVSDSEYNMYIPYYNNSLFLAKINGSGEMLWQIGLGDSFHDENLMIDANDTLFLIGNDYENTRILKINSSGFILKELVIAGFPTYGYDNRLFDDMLIITRYDLSIFYCYDVNLNYKWNYNISDHVIPHFSGRIDFARDSHGNIYILQDNNVGDISLLKINSTGKYISQILWGGPNNELLGNLIVDSENNIYFICNCEYYSFWGEKLRYTILVKNPVNGGSPPEPGRDLDIHDYFLFSVVGIACIISPIALLSILRSKKKRIS